MIYQLPPPPYRRKPRMKPHGEIKLSRPHNHPIMTDTRENLMKAKRPFEKKKPAPHLNIWYHVSRRPWRYIIKRYRKYMYLHAASFYQHFPTLIGSAGKRAKPQLCCGSEMLGWAQPSFPFGTPWLESPPGIESHAKEGKISGEGRLEEKVDLR